MTQTIRKIIGFLGSIRLAIILLIIITVVSIFGILIPQGLPYNQYYHKWGAIGGKGLLLLGIDHVFSTTWFYLLLGLLSCNIAVCSITRLWKNIRNSLKKSFLTGKTDIEKCRHSATITSIVPGVSAKGAIIKILKRQHYALLTREEDGGFQVVARKGVLKDIGSLIFHLSIVILFIGGIIGAKYGYSLSKDIRNGQIISIPDRSFLLRSDWFKLELNDDGSPKDFKTKLSVLSPKDSSLILEKVIEVNAPLSYEGIMFYQSSYGQDNTISGVSVHIMGPGLADSGFTGTIAYETITNIPNSDLTVTIGNYLPDFIIDMESRIAGSRSDQPNNPAVKIVLTRGNDTLYNHWAFAKFPNQHATDEAYKIMATEFGTSFYTGIQIRKNPGVPLIWIGILLMTAGIFAVFYIPKKSLWVLIDSQSTITIGGTSNRAPADFQTEFEKLESTIKSLLKQKA